MPSIKGFKNITGDIDKYDINSLDAPFTAEVGQVLVVKEIDENGHPVEWKTADKSNCGPFVITVTHNNSGYVSDKTHAEILEAYNKGQTIYAVKDNCIYYLNAVSNNSFKFSEHTATNGSITSGHIMINPFMVMYVESSLTKEAIGNSYSYDMLETENKTLVGAINEIDGEIPTKLSDLENDLDLEVEGTVEITSGEPTKASTVMTLNPNAEEVKLYTAPEVDELLQNLPSGGREKGFELVYEFEATEEISNFFIDKDLNGNPFEIKEIYIFVKIPIVEKAGYFRLFFNDVGEKFGMYYDTHIVGTVGSASNTSEVFYNLEISSDNKMYVKANGTRQGTAVKYDAIAINGANGRDCNPIHNICSTNNGFTIPVGFTMKIYKLR